MLKSIACGLLLSTAAVALSACGNTGSETEAVENQTKPSAPSVDRAMIDPAVWPTLAELALDPEVEARVDDLLSKMTLEQKVGQVIQGDSNALTAEDVKNYRLGSVLSGGNSAPGDKPYAEVADWLEAADAYYLASLDTEGVEVAIPTLWGIDAVHGHTNVVGGIVYPHNVGLGAARDPDLVRRIAQATAVELNVSGHDWTFAPTLAVPQNDRWGRGYEGFSEDPEVVKSYGGAIVEGLQGDWGSDDFMATGRVISTAKHFLGDGGTTDGVDQGDARISQEELRDVHLPGYETAIASGTQSVMASFSSWQGQPMHGQKELLTDVLKGRMNFNGFVIGDWNGHALIPGCTATDCPQSLNAGLDMYMAPDSWKGLYESTLRHVNEGTIPMERLDDAVRRILRVKVQSGLFESVKPSDRPMAGNMDLLGSAEHRALAREAVRKSVVLLKNEESALPIADGSNIHVVGAGADQIVKFAGGWTLSWQGRDHSNSDFPNGETFLQALRREAQAEGSSVTFGDDVPADTDVVIAVYGEDPYAEFQGDVENVDFTPNDFDPEALEGYREAGHKVVSVFLSGRPLWTNPELNDSDAFVAAFLPGSEPAGLVDLLLQTDPAYDFTGTLSFSWPKRSDQAVLDKRQDNYDPLFPVGYGLSYAQPGEVGMLSEDGAGEAAADKSVFFDKGMVPQPFRLTDMGSPITLPYLGEALSVVATDFSAQEDALTLAFNKNATFAIFSAYPKDYSREANGAMELVFMGKSFGDAVTLDVAAGCIELGDCNNYYPVTFGSEWSETRISLRCAKANGADLTYLKTAMAVKGEAGQEIGIADVRLGQESSDSLSCDR
jgi:beta-glucosidase